MAKIAFSCRNGTALYRLATQGTHTGLRATGAGRDVRLGSLRSIASSAAMCVAVVPQQPPIRLTPSSATKRSSQLASSAAPSG